MNVCPDTQDIRTTLLSLSLIIGLILSYLPQHLRIILSRSSSGLSPYFLLLGSTSSASGFLNIIILQYPLIKCCAILSPWKCIRNLLGLIQVGCIWFLFTGIGVLYLVYFPLEEKYVEVVRLSEETIETVLAGGERETDPLLRVEEPVPTFGSVANGNGNESTDHERMILRNGKKIQGKMETTKAWRLASTLSIIVALHLILLSLLAFTLLTTLPTNPPHPLLSTYALFLGLLSTFLTLLQYAPQLLLTYRSKLVGALSIPMMCIQVPGSAVFVLGLIGREGVEWSSWLVYVVSGVMQGSLLIMCIIWKRRQRRLGHDDFGRPLAEAETNGAHEVVES